MAIAWIAASQFWRDGLAPAVLEGAGSDFGAFDGLPAQIALLSDGRKARLLAPLSFIGTDGQVWPVPAGAMLDGASIPRAFWALIGGPFEGRYRDGSIVHDHYCDTRTRPWRAVHRMFYEAMRCSGESAVKAKIMYYAVYRFGPRWPGAQEAMDEAAETLTGPAAPSVALDAQAIGDHGLNLDEIDALADARSAPAQTAALENMDADPLARARLLVITGGRGKAADLEAVAREAVRLPDFVKDRFEQKGIRLIACRDSVTDFQESLRGVTPRGWEGTGRTWDDVPGTYIENLKRVIIATLGNDDARFVPTSASGKHGSHNLVIHESLHGYDYSGHHAVLRDSRFTQARTADFDRLDTYQRQSGEAGLEETFAESGARAVVDTAAFGAELPHLASYWTSFAGAAPAAAQESTSSDEIEPNQVIGTAHYADDEALMLDLRAEGPGGAIGHALLTIRPEEPAYRALTTRVGGARESIGSDKVPFRAAPEAASGGSPADQPQGQPIMTNPRAYLESVDIDTTIPARREDAEAPPPLDLDKIPAGVVSGTTLIDFSAVASGPVRSSVSLAMLFASRVATKAVPSTGDEDQWLASYTSSLSQLGFSLGGTATMKSQFKKTGLEVHEALIPFLTVAFGGAAVGPIILAALNNLKDMNRNAPWITLFDQQTRRFNIHELHFAAVSSNDTETSIRYAVARLNVATSETTILFFKLTSAEADFESSTTTMSANNSLLAVIEPFLRERLGAMSQAFITSAAL